VRFPLVGSAGAKARAIYNTGVTAILCVNTNAGLVIGADGVRVANDGKQVCDSVQKIFLTNQPNFHGAHAWTNCEEIAHTVAPAFRFSEETQSVIESVPQTNVALSDLLTRTAGEIYKKLLNRFGQWIDPRILQETEVTSALFVGYIGQQPQGACLTFPHRNGFLSHPSVRPIEMPVGFPSLLAGSVRVLKDVWPTDSSTTTLAISQGTELVQRYLETCIAQRDTQADCHYIGGHIHIAKVTHERADWLVPPKGQDRETPDAEDGNSLDG